MLANNLTPLNVKCTLIKLVTQGKVGISPPVRRALSSRLRLQHLKKGRVQRKDSDIYSGIGLHIPKYTQLLAENFHHLDLIQRKTQSMEDEYPNCHQNPNTTEAYPPAFEYCASGDDNRTITDDNVNEESGDVAMADQGPQRRGKLRADHGTSGAGASTGGKSVTALQGLLERNTLPVEVGITAVATLPFITSSVSLTPERDGGGRTDSVTGLNLRTQHPAERFVVLSDSPCHSSSNVADAEVSFVVKSLVSEPPIMTVAIATMVVADTSSILVPRVGGEPVHASIFADSTSAGTVGPDIAGPSQPAGTELSADTFYVSQDMDSETLHQIYVPKWNVVNKSALDGPDLFAEFNVRAARQTCLGAEVRMWLEHELRGREKFEGKYAMQANLLKERDAEIATVEAAEAARVSELDGLKERNAALKEQVAALESAVVIKDTELVSSNAQIAKLTQVLSNFQLSCDELSIKDASLESEKDKLIDQVFMLETTCSELRDEVSGYKLFKEQIEAVHDEQVKVLSYKVAGLDADLMGMALHLDEEFYPRFLTTIAGLRWILGRGLKLVVMKSAGIDYGKAGKGLANVAAYDPSTEAHFVSAMNALRVVDFPLFAQLAFKKDASITDIIGLLNLEGPAAETPEAEQLQPSPEQIMLHIHHVASQRLSISEAMIPLIEPLSAENLVGEASSSGVPALITTTALSTTFVQTGSVPPVSVADYEVSGAGPSTRVPSPLKFMFEKEELETTPEHTTVD
ncbi:hypothetical protein Tco_0237651 [Tanacetum coccineum]